MDDEVKVGERATAFKLILFDHIMAAGLSVLLPAILPVLVHVFENDPYGFIIHVHLKEMVFPDKVCDVVSFTPVKFKELFL